MIEKPSRFDGKVSNMEFVNLYDIVLKLKAVREKEGLSIKDILDRLESQGYHLAESTVRRVFQDNSEIKLGFTYAKVLKPIADVLLEENETADDPALLEKNEALHSIIREKNREIESLQSKIDDLTAKNEEAKRQLDDIRKMYDKRIDDLWGQIHIKDRRIDEKEKTIQRLMEKCL